MAKKSKKKEDDSPGKPEVFGNPVYSSDEDIYSRAKKETFNNEDTEENKEKKPEGPGNDLDVPGAELDDADEMIGEEDEENNYYSLGGDDHNDLDEEDTEPEN